MHQDTVGVSHPLLRLRKCEVQLFYPLLRYNQVEPHHKHVSHALLYLDQLPAGAKPAPVPTTGACK